MVKEYVEMYSSDLKEGFNQYNPVEDFSTFGKYVYYIKGLIFQVFLFFLFFIVSKSIISPFSRRYFQSPLNLNGQSE